MNEVVIGNKTVGSNQPTFVVAEIGINHNGDVEIAKKLIDAAADAGCDAVKFQKRTVEVVYTPEELTKPRENPFGDTNGDLKRGLEFGKEEFDEIDVYCKKKNILWFASCWDEGSVDFIEQYNPPTYKIASASLTDDRLLKYTRATGKPIILSTGMSTLEMVRHAVKILGGDNLIICHATSTYPCELEEINLSVIQEYQKLFPDIPIGFSGHERGILPTVAAAVMGATVVERHITLDRAMWGSDQAASVEPRGMELIVKYIREYEKAKGDGEKIIYESEKPIIEKLRRVG